MRHFETKGKGNWNWFCCDYTRNNGLNSNNKTKQGARALEISLSLDAPGAHEDSENSNYLIDQESILRSSINEEMIHQEDNLKGALEILLSPLNFKQETMEWITQSFKVKMN